MSEVVAVSERTGFGTENLPRRAGAAWSADVYAVTSPTAGMHMNRVLYRDEGPLLTGLKTLPHQLWAANCRHNGVD